MKIRFGTGTAVFLCFLALCGCSQEGVLDEQQAAALLKTPGFAMHSFR